MSAKKGWNIISKAYQSSVRISLVDVHYGPISPGETELKLLGDVEGKDILEVGCGGGQNAIVLAKWGARSVGLDISEEQIKYARRLARKHTVRVQFYVGNMEGMDMLNDESFDIVLSSCAIGYSENYGQAFSEAFRVLRRGGLFVFCVVHPIANRGRAVKYGRRKMWGIGSYFDRRRRTWTWKFDGTAAKFCGYHRTLQDYFNSLVSAGFIVEKILEPEPYPLTKMTEEEKQKIPYYWEGSEKEYDTWRRVPYILIFKARKSLK
ncbi:MAG: methyltransferase domain-containing protein [Candidatus Bathyarchaeota archaeon]|nr:methyltransferase domain-containing protein [Candidatus Bathyarchaeota archaeon]MDH5495244.1 methyltransferase domain-containing protein [Candidatus Bathyarchaeota archaeon]